MVLLPDTGNIDLHTKKNTIFPNCRRLREDRSVTINQLASEAGVGRELVSTLERGLPHRRLKVMAIFNALNEQHYGGTLDSDVEVTTANETRHGAALFEPPRGQGQTG